MRVGDSVTIRGHEKTGEIHNIIQAKDHTEYLLVFPDGSCGIFWDCELLSFDSFQLN